MSMVKVADNTDQLKADADQASRLHSATGWELAAYVYAWTEDNGRGRPKNDEKSSFYSIDGFAALGIRGLKTKDSVRKYRKAWAAAIERGFASEVEPGDEIDLPDMDFAEFVSGTTVRRNAETSQQRKEKREQEPAEGDQGPVPSVDEVPDEELGEPVEQVEATKTVDTFTQRMEVSADGIEDTYPGMVGSSLKRLSESISGMAFSRDPRRSYLHAADAFVELVTAINQELGR